MAQSTIIEIPNQPKNTIRAHLNELIKASYTMWAGSVEPVPSPTGSNPKSTAYMWWNDTNNLLIKLRNADNTDWYVILDYSNLAVIGSGGVGFKPYKKVSKDILIISSGQVDFTTGEEYVTGSLSVYRNGVRIRNGYVTESDQSTDPGEFTLDSTYISDNPFDTTYEELSVEYNAYI